MKKQIVIIGVIAILVSVGLSGCEEDDSATENTIPIQNQPRTLVGWYYVFISTDTPLNNTLLSDNITYLIHFFEDTEKNMRLIANKDTPGDINIGIGTERGKPTLSFQTDDNQIESLVVMEYNASNFYYIWSENGDANVTLLQYYHNFEIPFVYDWLTFIEYEGD